MMLLALLCLSPLAAALPLTASGAEIEFELRTSTTSAELGVPMTVSAVVRAPRDLEVLPDLAASTTDAYAIRDAKLLGETSTGALKGSPSGALKERRFTLELLPLDVGKIEVRVFWATRAGGSPARAESPPFTITVAEPDLGPEPQLGTSRPSFRPVPRSGRGSSKPSRRRYWLWKRRNPDRRRGEAPRRTPVLPTSSPERARWLRTSGLWEEGATRVLHPADRHPPPVRRAPLRRSRHAAHHDRLAPGAAPWPRTARDLEVKDLFDRDLAKFAKWKPSRPERRIAAGREIVAARPTP